VFNEMRESNILDIAEKLPDSELVNLSYASPFSLPSGAIYNIFHPSDPVAYRIEPLLLPPEMHSETIPPPVHLTAEGQSVRLHVKAQQFGDEIGKLANNFFEGKNRGGLSTLFTQAVSAIGKIEGTSAQRSVGPQSFPLGGKSSRVDFQLQRGVVDNEYLSAVSAHSNYFINTDFQDFLTSICAKIEDPTTQDAPIEAGIPSPSP
jgi:hypothetical protein